MLPPRDSSSPPHEPPPPPRTARPRGPSRRRRPPSKVERRVSSLLMATLPARPRRRHDAQPHAPGRVKALPLVGLDPARAMRVARAQRPPPLPRGWCGTIRRRRHVLLPGPCAASREAPMGLVATKSNCLARRHELVQQPSSVPKPSRWDAQCGRTLRGRALAFDLALATAAAGEGRGSCVSLGPRRPLQERARRLAVENSPRLVPCASSRLLARGQEE